MNCLDEILAYKRREVAEKAQSLDLDKLRERITPRSDGRSFSKALLSPPIQLGAGSQSSVLSPRNPALIAEIKRASPSAGLIREDFQVTALARAYERGGAHALSVLTDRHFFQGQLKYLLQARMATQLPCLRKDFVVDEYQIWEARLAEADAVLLIVAALKPEDLSRFMGVAREAELETLVEVHDEKELGVALEAGASIIGINNRNLQTLETDLKVTELLAPRAPKNTILISESGIQTPADVQRVRACGVHAILVGESLMRQPDVESAVRALLST